MKRVIGLAGLVCAVVLIGKTIVADPALQNAAPPVSDLVQVGAKPTTPVHVIDRPGVYGLAVPPEGSQYAIVGNNLVRVSRDTGEILAVIRTAISPVNEASLP